MIMPDSIHNWIHTITEHIHYLPWLMVGQERRRVEDNDNDGILLRSGDPTYKMWSIIVAALFPLGAALWWIDGRIETHIIRAIGHHDIVAMEKFAGISRRIEHLEEFQQRGGRFTEQDGKDMRTEYLSLIREHEKRLDVLENRQ